MQERACEFECALAAEAYDANSASARRRRESNDGVCCLHFENKRSRKTREDARPDFVAQFLAVFRLTFRRRALPSPTDSVNRPSSSANSK